MKRQFTILLSGLVIAVAAGCGEEKATIATKNYPAPGETESGAGGGKTKQKNKAEDAKEG